MKNINYKNYLFFMMTLLGIILVVIFKQFSNQPDDKVLLKAFKQSEAELYKADFNYWGKINSKYMNKEQLSKIILSTCKKLDFKNTKGIKISEKNGVRQAIWVQNANKIDNSTVIVAESILNRNSNKAESYLIIDDDLGKKINKIAEIRNAISKVYENYNCTPIKTICLIGQYNNKLKTNRIKDIEDKVFDSINASIVQRINTNDLNTATAYSPMLNNQFKQKGAKINVNISCSYNVNEKKTYLYLATPVIANEY